MVHCKFKKICFRPKMPISPKAILVTIWDQNGATGDHFNPLWLFLLVPGRISEVHTRFGLSQYESQIS